MTLPTPKQCWLLAAVAFGLLAVGCFVRSHLLRLCDHYAVAGFHDDVEVFSGELPTSGPVVVDSDFKANRQPMTDDVLVHCDVNGRKLWVNRKDRVIFTPEKLPWQFFRREGMARIFDGQRFGWVDKDNNSVIPIQFEEAEPFHNPYITLVRKDGENFWINRRGEKVTGYFDPRDHEWHPVVQYIHDSRSLDGYDYRFDDAGMARCKFNNRYGWINQEGQIVIEPIWEWMNEFDSHGWALAYANCRYCWLDRTGQVVLPPNWEAGHSFDDHDMAAVSQDSTWGWIDRQGEWVIQPQFESVKFFNRQGLAPVQMNALWGVVDRNGTIVLPSQWEDLIGDLEDDWFRAQKGKHWGWIDASGEWRIPPEWDSVHGFDAHGAAWVWRNGLGGTIDRSGECVIPITYDTTLTFDENGLAELWSRDDPATLKYIDRQGKTIFQPSGSIERYGRFYFAELANESCLFNAAGQPHHHFPKETLFSRPSNGAGYLVEIPRDQNPWLWRFDEFINRVVGKEISKFAGDFYEIVLLDQDAQLIPRNTTARLIATASGPACLLMMVLCLSQSMRNRRRDPIGVGGDLS